MRGKRTITPLAPCGGSGTDPVSETVPTVSGTGFFHARTQMRGMRTTNHIDHIRMGPPEEGETPIPDASLAFLILGCFRAAAMFEQFPIKIREIVDNMDDEGLIQSFTIVTESGLRFTTRVEYEPAPPVPHSKEENIAFRKDWDEQVKP